MIQISPLLLLCVVLSAQQPSFEAVSVKPSAPIESGKPFPIGYQIQPDRFHGSSETVQSMIAYSEGMPRDSVTGGPAWSVSDRFEIDATLPPGSKAGQIPAMMRQFLEERFQLKMHREMRQTPVYELREAKNGAKLTPAVEGTAARSRAGNGFIDMSSISLSLLANTVQRPAQRRVFEKTGISGKYSFKLEWSPDENGPSIFTVLEEQYGLKLVPARTALDYVVIDRVTRPTEN